MQTIGGGGVQVSEMKKKIAGKNCPQGLPEKNENREAENSRRVKGPFGFVSLDLQSKAVWSILAFASIDDLRIIGSSIPKE